MENNKPDFDQMDPSFNVPPFVDKAPEEDDISNEAPSSDPIPTPPVAPVAPAPAPVAVVKQADFDPKAPIHGLVEEKDQSLEGIALETKKILAAQPKVTMMIPYDQGEKGICYRSVIINGYRFDIRKNTMVALPKSVAQLLMDSYQIVNDTLQNHPTNLSHADSDKKKALGL